MSAFRRRLAKAAFLAVLLVLTPAWLTLVPPQDARAADTPVRFGPIPVRGDCRSYPGQSCTWDAWTGETTVSPKIVREGESISVSVSICCGAVSFQLPQMTGCKETKQPQDVEVKGSDGRWVLQKKDVVVASTCEMKPGPTRGGWATIGAGITGPCGSQIAVQEGRAEFAACGQAEDSDYYGVIPKEEELWAISGRLSAKDNRRIRGVLVELSGDERQAAVTSASGDYAFLVKKGNYTVTTEEGFCASVDGSPVSGCSRSGSVSVPGSHSVDFKPAKEGVLKGTVLDVKGKGLRGATVSAVGKQGQTAVTDFDGVYTMTLVAGSYQVTAYGEWKAGKDAKGEPTLIRPVYCSSPIGDCAQRVTATVQGDDEQTINWSDRGIIGTPADEVAPQVADPSIDLDNPATIDLWFLASVLVAGGAGIAGAGAAAGGGKGDEGEGGPGGGGGGGGPPDKPWSELTEEEKERFRSYYIERWKQAHPNASGEQLAQVIGLLYDQPDSFWDRAVQFTKDLGLSYWDDLSSGAQAEGLQATFESMATGFVDHGKDFLDFGKNLASGTWNELGQLPATLAEFPKVFGDDLASGAMNDRLQGMFEYGGGALETAGQWLSDPDAMKDAISKYGAETVDKFMAKARELDKAMMSADPLTIREKIGEIAGIAEFEAINFVLGDKALTYVADLRNAAKVNEAVDGIRTTSRTIEVTGATPEILARREDLIQRVAAGERVKLDSFDDAVTLFGMDERTLLNRQGTILQHSSGDASEGAFTVYKLSSNADSTLVAQQLRSEYPDLFMGKANAIGDKGFVPGEEMFMTAQDEARLAGAQPGQAVNYTPVTLSESELAELSPEMLDAYNARQKYATTWDKYEGYQNAKVVDLTDSEYLSKYGPMYVAEDAKSPAVAAEFWKDPTDNGLYVRYQTADGTWYGPKAQVSDMDTVTHGGGTGLTYDQSTAMQYKQSFGQLGEGDTPTWGMNMIEQVDGKYVLKDGADPNMLYKALDQLHKTEGQPVLVQNADGLFLETVSYPELDPLKQAAQTIKWDPKAAASLQSWGMLP